MSEAGVFSPGAAGARPAIGRPRRSALPALEGLERGFALYQSTFADEAWRYYAGAAPLVVLFIPMWVINGQIRLTDGTLLGETIALACAYVLRAWTVARYMQAVRARGFGVASVNGAKTWERAAALGRLLAWKIMLSAAALLTLPTVAGAPWFYGANEFATLEAQEGTERHSAAGCLRLAGRWYVGGLMLFLMMIPIWGAVWLNGWIVALMVPQLLHSILGVSTLLSTNMGVESLLRSSAFWLALFGGAWLAIDPVVKCSYVVVYQHLRSRREGDDLRSLLAGLPREEERKAESIGMAGTGRRAAAGTAALLAALLLCGATAARGQAKAAPQAGQSAAAEARDDGGNAARIHELRQALEEESRRGVYRWHDANHPSPPTWLDGMMAKFGNAMRRAWDAYRDFMQRLWPQSPSPNAGQGKPGGWSLRDLRVWLGLLALLSLTTGAFLIWRRRERNAMTRSVPVSTAPLPDMSDEAIATERSEDEWFALANRLEGEGELRLALRAAYLGLLAGLAQREWLTIRRDRTNREYLDEFTRRWKRRPEAAAEARVEIPEKLRGSLRVFDRVWYGKYAPTLAAVAAYRQDQRELLSHV